MNEPVEGWDPDLGEIVAVPEPFWRRSWRTLFRYKPACYECEVMFSSRALWEVHWLAEHYRPCEEV